MSTIQTAGRAVGNVATGPRARLAALAERRWFVAAVYLVLTVIALYPVFSVTVPPLVDYPNHLARMHILATWDSDPALQKNYVLNWSLHPNMAMDLIVPLLAKAMPIYMAGKIFIAMTMLSLLGGTLALRKALVGRIDLWPVLTFVILYNSALFWGFLNYLFTAGLALCAFAGWIALRERATAMRVLVFAAVGFVLYVGHIFGLFVYGLLVAGYEISRIWAIPDTRQRLIAGSIMASQFIAPFLLFVLWAAGNGSGGRAINNYGSLVAKFGALVSPANFGLLFVDLSTVAFLGVTFIACRSAASINLISSVRYSCVLIVLAAVAMPNYLMGVWGTDLRLPTLLGCVLIAGLRFERGSQKIQARLVLVALALVVYRTAAISNAWEDTGRKFDEFRSMVSVLPAGARLIALADPADIPAGKPPSYGKIFQHMPSLAVIERSVFLPTIFTGHTSIAAAETHRAIDTPVGNPVDRAMLRADMEADTARFPIGHYFSRYIRTYWVGWPKTFDYLVAIRFANDTNPVPEQMHRIAGGSYVDLYEITKGDARAP